MSVGKISSDCCHLSLHTYHLCWPGYHNTHMRARAHTSLTCRKLGLLETQYTLTVESKCRPWEVQGGTIRPMGATAGPWREGSVAASGQERLWAKGTRDELPIRPPASTSGAPAMPLPLASASWTCCCHVSIRPRSSGQREVDAGARAGRLFPKLAPFPITAVPRVCQVPGINRAGAGHKDR